MFTVFTMFWPPCKGLKFDSQPMQLEGIWGQVCRMQHRYHHHHSTFLKSNSWSFPESRGPIFSNTLPRDSLARECIGKYWSSWLGSALDNMVPEDEIIRYYPCCQSIPWNKSLPCKNIDSVKINTSLVMMRERISWFLDPQIRGGHTTPDNSSSHLLIWQISPHTSVSLILIGPVGRLFASVHQVCLLDPPISED